MFIKYPKIKILGDRSNEGILTTPGKIVIQEKIDGAQFGFYVENNILYFCSHNNNLTDSEQIAETGIPKNWNAIKPVLESWQNDPTQFECDMYYYGESMQKHTIHYGDDIPGFIGYDILHINTMTFLDYSWVKTRFENMGLPFIHVHYNKDISEVNFDELKELFKTSAYRNDTSEGIVIKRYDNQLMAKIVNDSFKEKHSDHLGRLLVNLNSDINEHGIVENYATSTRIEKMIHKLHDHGYEIEMPMMRTLYVQVVKDILEEEILEIYSEYKSINFKVLNNLVSKKCVKILKNVIMNNGKA